MTQVVIDTHKMRYVFGDEPYDIDRKGRIVEGSTLWKKYHPEKTEVNEEKNEEKTEEKLDDGVVIDNTKLKEQSERKKKESSTPKPPRGAALQNSEKKELKKVTKVVKIEEPVKEVVNTLTSVNPLQLWNSIVKQHGGGKRPKKGTPEYDQLRKIYEAEKNKKSN